MPEIPDQAVSTLLQAGKDLAGVSVNVQTTKYLHQEPPIHTVLNVPNGVSSTDITEQILRRLPTPPRRKGALTALSPESLINYVNRYVEDNRTAIFADSSSRKVVAVLNYHEPTGDSLWPMPKPETKVGEDGVEIEPVPTDLDAPGPRDTPHWGDFRVSYAFPLSRQWQVWKLSDGKLASQIDLAQFLEDNIRDIADPAGTKIPAHIQLMIDRLSLHVGSPARILEVARNLEIRSHEKVRQAVNTETGEQVVIYEQEHANGGNATVTELRVPTAFLLRIPVFQGDADYLLLCRLRYRKIETSVKWLINIQGVDASLEAAFKTGCEFIQKRTKTPLFYGAEPGATAL